MASHISSVIRLIFAIQCNRPSVNKGFQRLIEPLDNWWLQEFWELSTNYCSRHTMHKRFQLAGLCFIFSHLQVHPSLSSPLTTLNFRGDPICGNLCWLPSDTDRGHCSEEAGHISKIKKLPQIKRLSFQELWFPKRNQLRVGGTAPSKTIVIFSHMYGFFHKYMYICVF